MSSAQVKSAILLAGLYAEGKTTIREPSSSRDHSERMLKYFGANVERKENLITINGNPELKGRDINIPGDISAAAFFLTAGLIVPDSEILIKNVGINPTRTGLLEVLKKMGGNISILNQKELSLEPVADILVKSSRLKGITIGGDIIPKTIDELPIISVAASLAEGETLIKDSTELRFKETDRIKAMATELKKLGVEVEEFPDGMAIRGRQELKGAHCHSYGDHRVAMSLAVAGLVAK